MSANNNPDNNKPKTRYYKTKLVGLKVQTEPGGGREDVGVEYVGFDKHTFFNEDLGEHYSLGLLATDNEGLQKVLAKDHNVQEIKKEDYKRLTKPNKD